MSSEKIKNKLKSDFSPTSFILIVLFVLFLKGFYLIIQYAFPTGTKILTILDNFIPFISFFVIFYVLYYPFLILPLILNHNNKHHFLKTLGAMVLVCFCSFIIYSVFQTEMIRPTLIIESIFDRLVSIIYAFDKPLNLFPSLHVSLTTVAFLSLQENHKKFAKYFFLIAVGIILSTVFIKQHYVLDVFAGLILAGISYLIFFKLNKIKSLINGIQKSWKISFFSQ